MDQEETTPAPGDLAASLYPATSRYHGLPIFILGSDDDADDTRRVAYLSRRFAPSPEQLADYREHETKEGDRTDLLAFDYLNDPEQFWRLCDANAEMDPHGLVLPIGRRIRIALPEGFQAPSYE